MRLTSLGSQRAVARIAAACGILGPILLALYFNAPSLTNCPCNSATPALAAFIRAHTSYLYAGVWLQVIGTMLSIVFFLTIVQLAKAATRLRGLITIVACASLLSLVLFEGVSLAAAAQGVATGDPTTFATSFVMGTVFIRLYPLAPASVTYLGLGAVILGSGVLPRWLGYLGLGFGTAFEIAGLIAVFSPVGLVLVIVLATAQELWIIVAAIALVRSTGSPGWNHRPATRGSAAPAV